MMARVRNLVDPEIICFCDSMKMITDISLICDYDTVLKCINSTMPIGSKTIYKNNEMYDELTPSPVMINFVHNKMERMNSSNCFVTQLFLLCIGKGYEITIRKDDLSNSELEDEYISTLIDDIINAPDITTKECKRLKEIKNNRELSTEQYCMLEKHYFENKSNLRGITEIQSVYTPELIKSYPNKTMDTLAKIINRKLIIEPTKKSDIQYKQDYMKLKYTLDLVDEFKKIGLLVDGKIDSDTFYDTFDTFDDHDIIKNKDNIMMLFGIRKNLFKKITKSNWYSYVNKLLIGSGLKLCKISEGDKRNKNKKVKNYVSLQSNDIINELLFFRDFDIDSLKRIKQIGILNDFCIIKRILKEKYVFTKKSVSDTMIAKLHKQIDFNIIEPGKIRHKIDINFIAKCVTYLEEDFIQCKK
jgi:hypothetical protein